MSERHITVALLVAVVREEVTPKELGRRLAEHLYEICPDCKAAVEEFQALQNEFEGVTPADVKAAVESAMRTAEKSGPVLRAEGEQALDHRDTLVSLPMERARAAIAEGEFQGAALADALLDAAHSHLPGRPERALQLAELAVLVLDHSPDDQRAIDARVRAFAHIGNGLRAAGQLAPASHMLSAARWCARYGAVFDPLTVAEVDWIEGALRRDQRRYDEALPLLIGAVQAFQELDDDIIYFRSVVSLACLYHDMGDYLRAAELDTAVLASLAPSPIKVMALQNLVDTYLEAGRVSDAASLLEDGADLFAQADQLTQLRAEWIRGKVAFAQGHLEVAEAHLRTAVYGMAKRERPFDVALLYLDLSRVLLAARRSDEVRELAEELVTVFDGFGVHREAITALALYRDAVALDRISESEISELAAYLRAAAVDPGLRYRAPA